MPALFAAYVGALAAVTADTWATELGVLSTAPAAPGNHRADRNGGDLGRGERAGRAGRGGPGRAVHRRLRPGRWTRGRGTGAGGPLLSVLLVLPAALAGGLLGAWANSLLGATGAGGLLVPHLRQGNRAPRPHLRHPDPPPARQPWVDNEVVNLACAAVGAGGGALVYALLRALA